MDEAVGDTTPLERGLSGSSSSLAGRAAVDA